MGGLGGGGEGGIQLSLGGGAGLALMHSPSQALTKAVEMERGSRWWMVWRSPWGGGRADPLGVLGLLGAGRRKQSFFIA